jgi:thiamine biosynthesis lipoprotein ApbE
MFSAAPRHGARAGWVGEASDLMGTRVSVELWDDDEEAGRVLAWRVLDEYRSIDARMSTYKPDSEISRAGGQADSRLLRPSIGVILGSFSSAK